jgi:hypothetical protein
MTGQINMNTAFGKEIARIASDRRYTTFCEVGTWNGDGSTRCIYEGIKDRPEAQLYSIEGDPFMMLKAHTIWKDTPQVKLMMGTLHRNILTNKEVEAHPQFHMVQGHYSLHYASEYRAAMMTPIVSPPPCDVVLLDGGEFSTDGDWEVLYHDKLKVVMLDDTRFMKTHRVMNQLLADPNWKCLRNEPDDRGGWAIFERVEVSE